MKLHQYLSEVLRSANQNSENAILMSDRPHKDSLMASQKIRVDRNNGLFVIDGKYSSYLDEII